MNERIRELAEQSGKTYAESFRWEYLQDIDKDILGKFAELIVRECIEISQVGSITEEKIKRHFGVKE